MTQEFSIPVRVYYEDTDAGMIVYHANYLKFCERARSDFIRALGVDQMELLRSTGRGFVVAKMKARFVKPARLNDELTVNCIPVKLRRVSFTFLQQVKKDGELIFEMRSEIAYVNLESGKLQALPAEMVEAVKPYLQEDL